jgi:hypothetical protein
MSFLRSFKALSFHLSERSTYFDVSYLIPALSSDVRTLCTKMQLENVKVLSGLSSAKLEAIFLIKIVFLWT